MKQFFLLEIDVGPGHFNIQDVMEVVDDELCTYRSAVTDGYELPEDTARAVMAAVDNRAQEVS